jgi:hypothetical protein
MMPVFSRGTWLSVLAPKFIDPCWSKKDLQLYATIYAEALAIHGDKLASILAEVAVNKRLYPEVTYDAVLEAHLQNLYD